MVQEEDGIESGKGYESHVATIAASDAMDVVV
jgi:hypothetical protein